MPHAKLLSGGGPAASAPAWWDSNVLESLTGRACGLHAQIEEGHNPERDVREPICAAPPPTEPVSRAGGHGGRTGSDDKFSTLVSQGISQICAQAGEPQLTRGKLDGGGATRRGSSGL